MNDDLRPAPAPSLIIPFAILALSFATLLIFQTINITKQHSTMEQTKTQLSTLITEREKLVKQSDELKAKLQALAVDLLQLAQTNEKAKAIVQKNGIQQSAPPTGQPAAPAPAAATP